MTGRTQRQFWKHFDSLHLIFGIHRRRCHADGVSECIVKTLVAWLPDPHVKLPADATIALEKLTHYLLVPQTRGDNSAFLSRAGYKAENADRLLRDLRSQMLPLDATPLQTTKGRTVL